jgi:hypothetical protein
VAVAENWQQDVVGADVVRNLHRLGEENRKGRIGMHGQPLFARVADGERADLNAVVERRALEPDLRLRVAERRLAVGRVLHADLDAIESDLARQGDLRDIAALSQVPVRHPDAHRQRVERLLRLGRLGSLCLSERRKRGGCDAGLLHKVTSGHRHNDISAIRDPGSANQEPRIANCVTYVVFRMCSQPLRYSRLLMKGLASGAFFARIVL